MTTADTAPAPLDALELAPLDAPGLAPLDAPEPTLRSTLAELPRGARAVAVAIPVVGSLLTSGGMALWLFS